MDNKMKASSLGSRHWNWTLVVQVRRRALWELGFFNLQQLLWSKHFSTSLEATRRNNTACISEHQNRPQTLPEWTNSHTSRVRDGWGVDGSRFSSSSLANHSGYLRFFGFFTTYLLTPHPLALIYRPGNQWEEAGYQTYPFCSGVWRQPHNPHVGGWKVL